MDYDWAQLRERLEPSYNSILSVSENREDYSLIERFLVNFWETPAPIQTDVCSLHWPISRKRVPWNRISFAIIKRWIIIAVVDYHQLFNEWTLEFRTKKFENCWRSRRSSKLEACTIRYVLRAFMRRSSYMARTAVFSECVRSSMTKLVNIWTQYTTTKACWC